MLAAAQATAGLALLSAECDVRTAFGASWFLVHGIGEPDPFSGPDRRFCPQGGKLRP